MVEPAELQNLVGVLNGISGLECAGKRPAVDEGIADWGIASLTALKLGLNFTNDLNIWKKMKQFITRHLQAWTGWENWVLCWRDLSISCLCVSRAPWPTPAYEAPMRTPCTRYNFR